MSDRVVQSEIQILKRHSWVMTFKKAFLEDGEKYYVTPILSWSFLSKNNHTEN